MFDRAQSLGLQDRHHSPVELSHRRPVRRLESGRPPAERLALEREVRIPARERVLLDLVARLGDARGEIGGEVRAHVRRVDVAAVDERQARRLLRELRGEGATDPRAPREADERDLVEPELGDQARSELRERGRPIGLRRERPGPPVARWIRRDHPQAVLLRQHRRELVRMETASREAVPVEQRRRPALTPLAHEQRRAVEVDRERLHAGRLRSQTRRRPSSVRNGSTRSSVRACGTMRSARPPVATVCASSPSSPRMRSTMPSTWPANP